MTRWPTKGYSPHCTLPSSPTAAQATGHDSSNIYGVGSGCLKQVQLGVFQSSKTRLELGSFMFMLIKKKSCLDGRTNDVSCWVEECGLVVLRCTTITTTTDTKAPFCFCCFFIMHERLCLLAAKRWSAE